MTIRRLSPKTHYQYIRHVKKFADFLGRSADKATAEDVHRYQLWLASIGTTVGTANVSATALRFFFKVTLKRHDLAEELISTREPRRLPVVLSPEEVGRLLAAATNTKHRAILSLAYATGLRASEVVSLKLTDTGRDLLVGLAFGFPAVSTAAGDTTGFCVGTAGMASLRPKPRAFAIVERCSE